MKKLFTYSVVFNLLAVLALATDCPQWGYTGTRNMVSEEKNLPATFVPGEKLNGVVDLCTTQHVRWAAPLGSFCCATPVIAGGKVFIGSLRNRYGLLNCFDEVTGKLLWQWSAPCRDDGDKRLADAELHWISDEIGVCSTPVVDGDHLFFVDHNCNVVCQDVNGMAPASSSAIGAAKELWRFDMVKDEHVGALMSDACNCSPLLDGDILYIVTSNGVDRRPSQPLADDATRKCRAPDAPSLIALDKQTGRFLGRDAAPIAKNMLHGQWSSPSMGVVNHQKLIFFGGGDGTLYAFKALENMPKNPVTLELVWWADCIPPEYRPADPADTFVEYCLGDRRRRGAKNKNVDGSYAGLSEIIATPVFYDNRVYVAIGRDPEHGRGRGALVCIDATRSGDVTQTGKIWCYQGLERSLSTVAIADGLLYIGDVAGKLHCVDAGTGAPQWVYNAKSRMIASPLVADGKVFMQTEAHLDVLSAGKELKLLGQARLGANSWVTPVAANGTLYVASRSFLWAVKDDTKR